MCRVLRIALYFFKFAVELKFLEEVAGAEVIVAARPLAVEDDGFVQFLAICLAAPQNMHSLLSKRRFHSAGSNLPSLPRTEGAVVAGVELEDFWKLLLLGLGVNAEGVDLAGVEVLDAASADLLLLRESSWVHSR